MEKERNYGIDFLRILSMFLIVTLHVLGHGGVLEAVTPYTINYEIAWFLEISAYCAVNCYALISGFVGIDAKFKYSNIVYLWLQVVFYSVILTGVFAVFVPQIVGVRDVLQAFLPVMYGQYWYFTAYFCMFFFIPALNHIVNTMEQPKLKMTIISAVVLFSLIPTLRNGDLFNTKSGYSALWLAVLYVFGAYVKKYVKLEKVSLGKLAFTFLLCVAVTWGSRYILRVLASLSIIGSDREMMLVSYTSPTILMAGIVLLMLFSHIRVGKTKKVIKFLSPLTFGVYLIHDNVWVRNNIIHNLFGGYAKLHPLVLIIAVLITVLAIYVLCSLVDFIRLSVFKGLRIKERLEKQQFIYKILRR